MSTSPEARIARLARSPEDAAALARFDRRMALPLVLSAVLPLFIAPGHSDTFVVDLVIIVSWVVFVWDFAEHMRRLKGYLGTWWGRVDLMVVLVTAPWFLVVGPSDGKFVMIVRLARLARVLMATAGARRLFERLGRVALVAGIVVFFGAFIAYRAEHPTNPEYATFGDSLWWGIVTLTTVGYGDVVPKTTAGRAAGVMIMLTGIGVLGLLAGSLASFFRLEPKPGEGESGASADASADGAVGDGHADPRADAPERSPGPLGALTAEIDGRLAAVEAQVGLLVEQVRRLADRG
jgi:voltage-gated potassium channel